MENYKKFSLHADRLILLITLGFLLPSVEPKKEYAALIYKNCANETFTDQSAAASSHEQTLTSLFNELVSHSLQSKFFRTTAGNVTLAFCETHVLHITYMYILL